MSLKCQPAFSPQGTEIFRCRKVADRRGNRCVSLALADRVAGRGRRLLLEDRATLSPRTVYPETTEQQDTVNPPENSLREDSTVSRGCRRHISLRECTCKAAEALASPRENRPARRRVNNPIAGCYATASSPRPHLARRRYNA